MVLLVYTIYGTAVVQFLCRFGRHASGRIHAALHAACWQRSAVITAAHTINNENAQQKCTRGYNMKQVNVSSITLAYSSVNEYHTRGLDGPHHFMITVLHLHSTRPRCS